MIIDKHMLYILLGFMIDKISIFPFLFGFVIGTSVSTTTSTYLSCIRDMTKQLISTPLE